MKKIGRLALAAFMLFCLAGCSGAGSDTLAGMVKETYQAMTSASAQAEVRAMADGQDFVFKLAYDWGQAGETVTVLEPEAIGGVIITFKDGVPQATEEGIVVASGLDGTEGCTPVDVIPGLMRALAGDIPADTGKEKWEGEDCIALTYENEIGGRDVTRRVRVDAENFRPRHAQIYIDGKQVMTCDFSLFDSK